jgi:nucleoside-diphosphate-sugar epimerase
VSLRVLVTGGSGFIGTNLVEHFRARGDDVVNFDIACPRNSEHASVWQKLDILDAQALKLATEAFSPHLVFHMAARTDLDGQRSEEYLANIEGVRNVIEALKALPDLRRAIFASSMLVCKLGFRPRNDHDYSPTTAYGASKVEGERLVRLLGTNLPWVMVRPTSLWGPWFDIPYRKFFDAVRSGWYVHPKGLVVRRSYGFVLNSVTQLERLSFADLSLVCGRTFYLADYRPVELRSWAESIRQAFGAPNVKEAPLWLLRVAATAGDVLRSMGMKNPPLTSFRLGNLTTEAVMDTAPLEKVCGSIPYGLQQSVLITTDWIKRAGKRLRH